MQVELHLGNRLGIWVSGLAELDTHFYFNGAWCYPDPIDRPQRVEAMDRLELAYW